MYRTVRLNVQTPLYLFSRLAPPLLTMSKTTRAKEQITHKDVSMFSLPCMDVVSSIGGNAQEK
jgi:hypothetical protein